MQSDSSEIWHTAAEMPQNDSWFFENQREDFWKNMVEYSYKEILCRRIVACFVRSRRLFRQKPTAQRSRRRIIVRVTFAAEYRDYVAALGVASYERAGADGRVPLSAAERRFSDAAERVAILSIGMDVWSSKHRRPCDLAGASGAVYQAIPVACAGEGRARFDSTYQTHAVRNAGKVIAKAAYMRYNGCKSTKERVCFA